MKRLVLVLLATALAACAMTPPLPPECEGALVPINGVGTVGVGGEHEARPSR